MNIWMSNIWTAEKDVKTQENLLEDINDHCGDIHKLNSYEKNEKNLNGIQFHDLWDKGGLTYQLNLGLWDESNSTCCWLQRQTKATIPRSSTKRFLEKKTFTDQCPEFLEDRLWRIEIRDYKDFIVYKKEYSLVYCSVGKLKILFIVLFSILVSNCWFATIDVSRINSKITKQNRLVHN